MRLLELFSGTKSVGRAFEALGWEVTSLDRGRDDSAQHLRRHSGVGLPDLPARALRFDLGLPRLHGVL